MYSDIGAITIGVADEKVKCVVSTEQLESSISGDKEVLADVGLFEIVKLILLSNRGDAELFQTHWVLARSSFSWL